MQLQTTMASPAQARQYFEITSVESLSTLLDKHHFDGQSIVVLGQGSNTIFTDDFNGVVLANRILGRLIVYEDQDSIHIRFGAGESWHDLVVWTLQNNWYGLEQLALIPGLIGAAPIQNIGAYGVELKDVFVSLECIDIKTVNTQSCSLSDCQFAYRDSIFKQRWRDKKVITSVTLCLHKKMPKYSLNNLYPALREIIKTEQNDESKITAQDVFQVVCDVRSSKLPDPGAIPNSGSFFKNPLISAQQQAALLERFPDLVNYPVSDGYKLAAAWLIERAGFKGFFDEKGIGCYAKQALVLINPQRRKGSEVLNFARQVQQGVEQLFDVTLEIEPRIYP